MVINLEIPSKVFLPIHSGQCANGFVCRLPLIYVFKCESDCLFGAQCLKKNHTHDTQIPRKNPIKKKKNTDGQTDNNENIHAAADDF